MNQAYCECGREHRWTFTRAALCPCGRLLEPQTHKQLEALRRRHGARIALICNCNNATVNWNHK